MASQVSSRTKTKPGSSSASRQSAKVRQYVNHQLEKTRRQVKSTDLIYGVLSVVVFAMGFLLLAALWDAWVWPLSGTGRWISFGLLMTGCCLLVGFLIVPLMMKRINPDYAAKMIEEAKPSFKNSLLNYVSLRRKNEAVNPAVFDAISRQAAKDLSTVPSDATVDRSKLIQLGFVLIALMVFGVGYKMLSPKDPLQTFGRVLAPGAKIAKPAVVKILEVQPGDAKVFFGDTLEVTAIVRGSHQPQDVKIEFSTLDGQLTNQSLPMRPDGDGNRYRADLSVAGGGIQQSLTYRVVARDGASPDFRVSVQPNPTIAVESIVLRPPAYSKLPETSFQGQGNIDALEGTEVTINAIANLPIQLAYIELLNEVTGGTDSSDGLARESVYQKVRSFDMQSDGKSATASLTAQLNAARTKQFATHYRVKFVSADGDRNSQANIYSIRVTPDLAPEIKIVQPVENDVSIPENGSLLIEVEANDLDFEISSVKLQLDRQAGRLVDANLKLESNDNNQRVRASYLLKPETLGLQAGNQAIFFATASDNRTSPQSGQPDPNISRSENFTLTITEAEPTPEEQPKPGQQPAKENAADQPPPQDPKQGQQDPGQQQQDGDQEKSGKEAGSENEQGSGEDTESESGDQGEAGSQQNRSESSSENGESESSAGEQGSQAEGSEGTGSEMSKGNSEGQSEGESGGSESTEGAGENSDGSAGDSQQQSGSGANQGGASQAGSQSSNRENQSAEGSQNQSGDGSGQSRSDPNRSPLDNQNQRNQAGDNADSAQGAGETEGQRADSLTDGQRQPLDENASEAEQFRRLQELLEAQQRKDDPQSGSGQNQQDPSGQQSGSDSQNQQAGERGGNPDAAEQQTDRTNEDGSEPPNRDNSQQDDSGQTSGEPGKTAGGESGQQNSDQQNSDPRDSASQKNGTDASQQDDSGQQKQDAGSQSNGDTGSKSQDSGDPSRGNSEKSTQDQQSGQANAGMDDESQQEQKNDPNRRESSDGPSNQTNQQSPDAQGKQSGDQGEESGESGNQPGGNPGQQGPGNQDASQPEDQQSGQGSSDEQASKSESGSQGSASQQESQQTGDGGLAQAEQQEAGSEGGSQGEGEPGATGSQQSSGSQADSGSQESSGQDPAQPQEAGQPSSQSGNPAEGSSQQSGQPGEPSAMAQGSGSGSGTLPTQAMQQEQANLEHARKATDMILNRLNNEKYDPDPELLKNMGWTEDDMKQFLSRWQEMKRQAETGDVKAQARYEKALKKLGLRPNQDLRNVGQNRDRIEGLNEDSAVVKPLPHLERDFNATLRDINRADNN